MKRLLFYIIAAFLFSPLTGWGQSLSIGSLAGFISACQGSASAGVNIEQFAVSGTALTGNLTIQAPQYFEVSFSATGTYQSSISVTPTAGAANVTVYVRSSATAPSGTHTGNCTIITPGTASPQIAVNSLVKDLPAVNHVDDQDVPNGITTQNVHFTGTGYLYKWTNDNPSIGLPASGIGDIPPFTGVNNGPTAAKANITVTPYFPGYAYVGNTDSHDVAVVNTATQQVVTRIPAGYGDFSASVSPDGSRAYVANAAASTVTVINTANNQKITGDIVLGENLNPYGLVVSPDGNKVYVANLWVPYLSVIDAATNTLSDNIQLGFASIGIAASPDGNYLYVTDDDQNVAIVSTQTNSVVAIIPLPGAQPYGVAVTPDGKTLYIADYASQSVSVVDVGSRQEIKRIIVGFSPTGVAISPDGKSVYVAVEFDNSMAIINTADNSLKQKVAMGQQPFGISITPDGSQVYVVESQSFDVAVYDVARGIVVNNIPVGLGPFGPITVGNFISQGSCGGLPATFSITVDATPQAVISSSGIPSPLNTIYGTASTSTVFSVQGTALTAGVLVTPPAGFEVSTDDIQFSKTITLGVGGNFGPGTVYIRLAASMPVGSYSGPITLSSTGAASVTVQMPVSTVSPAELIIAANDITKYFGVPVPELTLKYTGFVNGDLPPQLTSLPTVTTTATATSAVGQYTIAVTGGLSPNYNIQDVDGVLTIVPIPLVPTIPTAFTPNGDGINDTWNIKNMDAFPTCSVQIFNRYGENVYSSIGYGVPWDGTYKGGKLPESTYYYIIDLKNGSKVLSGFVTILR